jgi:hypothetical protein
LRSATIHACRELADHTDVHPDRQSQQRFTVPGLRFTLEGKRNRKHEIVVRVVHQAAIADIALFAPACDKIDAWLVHDRRTRLISIGTPQLYAVQDGGMKAFPWHKRGEELYHSQTASLYIETCSRHSRFLSRPAAKVVDEGILRLIAEIGKPFADSGMDAWSFS